MADKTGRKTEKTVRRFHDAYQSYGGTLALGFLDKPWAKAISLQLFAFDFDKEIQHDALMIRPIGEAKYGASSLGATLRWTRDFSPHVSLDIMGSASRQTITFRDLSPWIYDWYGKKLAERASRGELDGPHDATIWQNSAVGRVLGQWRFRPEQALRISTTGRYLARTGTEKAIKSLDGIDLLAGERNVGTIISGAEWESNAFDMRPEKLRSERPLRPDEDDRLQNILALKHYYFRVDAENVKSGFDLTSLHTSGFRIGVADSLRFRLHKKISLKASYELAARIPDIEEFFGDALYIQPNLKLLPEMSHNGNLGFRIETRRTFLGNFTLDSDAFFRDVKDQIVPLASANGVQHDNVGGVSVQGVEGSLQWISPGNWVIFDGNCTWQDIRNVSTGGQYQKFDGERIPNRPWFFANWGARFQSRKLLAPDDGIAAYVHGRYVHEFFRTWESIGDRDFKAKIPAQIAHDVGITYWSNGATRTSVTIEVDNVMDARLFDFFGVQKPSRSVSVKVTGEI